MTYDEETKRKALEMIEQGMSLRTIAQKLKVSHTTVAKWESERLDQEKKTFPEVVYDENLSPKTPQPIVPLSPTTSLPPEQLRSILGRWEEQQRDLSDRLDDLQENLSLEKRFIKLEKQLAVLNQKVEDLYRLAMGKNKTE